MKLYLKILISVSIAFNIAFIGMFTFVRIQHHRMFTPTPFHQMEQHSEMFCNARRELKPLKDDYRKLRLNFFNYMTKDNATEEQMHKNLELMLEKQKVLEREVGRKFIDLRLKMSNNESKELFRSMIRNESSEIRRNFNHHNKKPRKQRGTK